MPLFRVFPALAALGFVTACAVPGPSAPSIVTLPDGRTGQTIYTSMQATEDPTPAQLQQASATLEGNGRGGLAVRASAACPGGYTIVDRTAPNARFVMTLANGVPLYKIEQRFTVVCN